MKQLEKRSLGVSGLLIIVLCLIVAECIFYFVYGKPSNFMNNDPNNHPLPGNLLGTIYKAVLLFLLFKLYFLRFLPLQ